jgi:flagellar motor switch protein FliM
MTSSGTGHVLSADAIAALVDAAREGRLPEESAAPQRRRRMRAVDFTRPTKFTADQERRLKRSLEAFCRTASTRLSAELRVSLELEVINTSQLTWSNAHSQVLPGSISGIVQIEPLGTRLLMSAELGLILGAIELLLGGAAVTEQRERRLSDIDLALARHFFDRMLAQLSVIWTDMVQLELNVSGLEMHLETAQMVSVSEPTLTFTMEARFNGVSSTIVLLLPWSAIAPVASRFAARDDAPDRGEEEIRRVRRAVGGVEMTVRAEVASVEMPIEQVLALQAGDVLRLEAPAEAGVTLFADKVPVHRAKPGRSGSRRAVQVTERVRRAR